MLLRPVILTVDLLCWSACFIWAAVEMTINGYRVADIARRTGWLHIGARRYQPVRGNARVLITQLFSSAFISLICFAAALAFLIGAVREFHHATYPVGKFPQALVIVSMCVAGWTLWSFGIWAHTPSTPVHMLPLPVRIGRVVVGICIAAPIMYGIGWLIWGR